MGRWRGVMPKLTCLKSRIQVGQDRMSAPMAYQMPDYRIRGRKLQEIRERHLRAHPMCALCHVRPATELDHIKALCNGGTDTDDNRQGLCHDCHAAKSVRDTRGG